MTRTWDARDTANTTATTYTTATTATTYARAPWMVLEVWRPDRPLRTIRRQSDDSPPLVD